MATVTKTPPLHHLLEADGIPAESNASQVRNAAKDATNITMR